MQHGETGIFGKCIVAFQLAAIVDAAIEHSTKNQQ